MLGTIDAKAAAGTLGGALALIIWTLLAALVSPIRDLPPTTLAILTTASATLLTGVLAYWVPGGGLPARGEGFGGGREISEGELAELIPDE